VAVPLEGQQRQRDRYAAVDLFRVGVADGVAFLDGAKSVGHARGEEHGLGKRSLAALAVT